MIQPAIASRPTGHGGRARQLRHTLIWTAMLAQASKSTSRPALKAPLGLIAQAAFGAFLKAMPRSHVGPRGYTKLIV